MLGAGQGHRQARGRSRHRPPEAEQRRLVRSHQLPHGQTAGDRHRAHRARGTARASSSSRAPRSAACRFRKSFLAQMVNFFTRTADNPKGSSIDDTFELPAKIQPHRRRARPLRPSNTNQLMAEDVLQMPLQFLKGVGPRKAADLKKAGLNTVEDLLFRFPRRYEDRSRMQTIISLRPGHDGGDLGQGAQRRPRARRAGPDSSCSRRWCRTTAVRSRRCGRTRRSSRTSSSRSSASCCSARSRSGDRAACRSPIPNSKS